MKISFLGQGYELESKNSVGNHLVKFLSEGDFDTFFGISAFTSEAGIRGISEYLKKSDKNYYLIVGIDQEGTSKEALYEILKLNINGYIFYQSEPQIFHPKIYIFEGSEVKIILGSSNLTAKGLFGNVEGSFLIEFEKNDEEGIKLLNELKQYYKGLFDLSDPNLFKIDSQTIESFISKGIVPNEKYRNEKYKKNSASNEDSKDNLKIPKRGTPKFPLSFKGKSKKPSIIIKVAKELELPRTEIPVFKHLLWRKEKLSKSDAQRVPEGTNPTGNLKLAQGRFKIDNVFINQQNYFRQIVFNKLNWEKTKSTKKEYEETFANFRVIIMGNDLGIYNLKLSHDPTRVAGQANTPTWLHWGASLISILQKINIVDKTINLYSIEDESTFLIQIV